LSPEKKLKVALALQQGWKFQTGGHKKWTT
jgi:hypothetical protein